MERVNITMETLISEVIHYYSIGHYKPAISRLNEGLSHDPGNAALYYLKAKCCYQMNLFEEAEDCCNQALVYNYSIEDCYYLLGRIAMDTGLYVKSEELLLKALQLNPNRADVIAIYGLLMLMTGHDKKALNLVEEGLKINPQDETANQVHFLYFLFKNDKEKIYTSLKQYIQFSSNEIHRLCQLGTMEINAKKYKSAKENFRQAFLLDPTSKEILEILQKLDQAVSPIFLPQRIIQKLGGPIFIWIIALTMLFILHYLHLNTATLVFGIFYFILCVYTWISPIIYKKILRY